jgi:mutator protein MutT
LSPDNPRPVVHVVAAALIDAADRVLIAQRLMGKHLAGGWEFPGGKLEQGEERLAGLARELQEELGIVPHAPRPLMRIRHSYPSRQVLLDVWVVRRYSGIPRGLDGQALRWCTRDELATADLLPADGPIVRTLWLPELLTQTSSTAYEVGVFGIGDLRPQTMGNRVRLAGASCRNAAEAAAASAAGADFLVLREPLSAPELATLCGRVSLPVYARGITLSEAWVLGATGVNEIGVSAAGAADSHQNTV